MINRYGDDPTPALREHVAAALVNKGVRLGVLDRYPDELTAYNEVITRYGDDPTPKLREAVERARDALRDQRGRDGTDAGAGR